MLEPSSLTSTTLVQGPRTEPSLLFHLSSDRRTIMPSDRHPAPSAAWLPCLFVALACLSSSCAQQIVTPTPLLDNQPVLGSLPANSTAYYAFESAAVSYQQTALISVSAFSGWPSLYVSLSDSTPSAASFDYQASWLTGGVVSVLTQPPYTAYVAVQSSSYSSCNYSVVVTAYQTGAQLIPVPLSSAVPLASATAAGEYRYYTYDVTAGTASVAVSLSETYGQSYLLINSPNATQLPTLTSYQYSSSSPAFPLVMLLQPAAGVWTVGVWSNQSSAFSIMAVDNNATQPMELGVTYLGWVQMQVSIYYSIYIDPQLLVSASSSTYLDLELYSVSGDADLYCSFTTTQPGESNRQWISFSSQADERILIPIQQLKAGTLYCAVRGWVTSSYTFSAAFGSAVTLTAGATTTAESATGGSQLYSLIFPSGQSFISLSVLCEVGTTQLFVGAYGTAPSYNSGALVITRAATVQLEQINATRLCGANNSLAIPGTNPTLCQMQVNIVTTSYAVYRISATLGGDIVQLTPGLPTEGVASTGQPAYLSFSVPDNLSNATLTVTVTNGASGLTLAAGPKSLISTAGLWTVTQQPGSDVLVFQLDWTDPLLPLSGRVAGQYAVVLSASSETVIFSAVYTVTNGSIFSDSIVQLLDGVPQDSIVSASAYDFYYFTPPLDGWPYGVTISVVWASGFGTVSVVVSNGTQAGPTSTDFTLASGSTSLVINPNNVGICNPTINAACGYSISVQGNRLLQGQAQYTIIVETGHWIRSLTYGVLRSPIPGGVLSVADSDFWLASVSAPSALINPQLLVAVAVSSGSVTIFASNVTAEPNATTAQLTWPNISSAAVLAVPVVLAQDGRVNSIYLTVTCVSTDSTPCQYTLEAQRYDERIALSTITRVYSPPLTLLLPAGGIIWAGYQLSQFGTLAYLVMQASVAVGSASLFASCTVRSPVGGEPLANETYNLWQTSGGSVSAPLAIEVSNFNVTAANCPTLVLGVRAGGGQPAQVAVSVATAGIVQQLTAASATGLVTPTYPVSYYRYTVGASDPSSVLTFSLRSDSNDCTTSQLQMAVSDTVPYPDPSNPSTYNFSRSAVTLPTGVTDLTIAISNYSRPAGSLHAGYYYLAIQSAAAGVTCQYHLYGDNAHMRAMPLGQFAVQSGGLQQVPAFFTFAPVPYNTSTSFAVQLLPYAGAVLLFVGVNSMPSPADPSTYLLTTLYNISQTASVQLYTVTPIYIPASACTSLTLVGQPCTVVVMATSFGATYSMYWQPMSSAGVMWLVEGQASPLVDVTSLTAATTYQFSLPAAPLSVTVAVNSTSPVAILCSYQYVTPGTTFYDWQTTSDSGATYPSTTPLTFTWDMQKLLTNPNSAFATAPTTCYCTVQANSFSSYTIAYNTTSLASTTSSSHELTGGALVAAVVVPIVAVLLLSGLLLWHRRSEGKCPDVVSHGRPNDGQYQHRAEEVEAREISTAELSVSRARDGRLMRQEWMQSDSA